MKFKDLTGMTIGRLTVLGRAENKNGRVAWNVICNCGNSKVVTTHELHSGDTRSCGCIHKEQLAKRNKQNAKHGMSKTKTYNTWNNIKDRCYNPNCKYYQDYGGRGISMYGDWLNNFQAFYDYVSKLLHFNEAGYSLDRINNDGNYEPNNLRWATQKEQLRNTRVNRIVEYQGRAITLSEVAELTGISFATLHNRWKRGDRGDRLFRPVKKRS